MSQLKKSQVLALGSPLVLLFRVSHDFLVRPLRAEITLTAGRDADGCLLRGQGFNSLHRGRGGANPCYEFAKRVGWQT